MKRLWVLCSKTCGREFASFYDRNEGIMFKGIVGYMLKCCIYPKMNCTWTLCWFNYRYVVKRKIGFMMTKYRNRSKGFVLKGNVWYFRTKRNVCIAKMVIVQNEMWVLCSNAYGHCDERSEEIWFFFMLRYICYFCRKKYGIML